MPRIVIIGGSGHIGTYLVPFLVERGHHVINVSRGAAQPYKPHAAWKSVEQVKVDRQAEEAAGTFGTTIRGLKADTVVDLIGFELDSVKHLVDALVGSGSASDSAGASAIQHYIFCSSIWVFGHSTTVPTTEVEPCYPIDDYGRKKRVIEEYLMRRAKVDGFPATVFRPGHIVGEGWIPLNPQGNFNPDVYTTIASGGELALPNLGLETIHHVHAEDCARWILSAMDNRTASLGECFNTVSPQALSLRGYAEAMYRFFGQEPKLSFTPLDRWAQANGVGEKDADATTGHISHSPCHSIEKSRKRLGYEPKYSSLEAVQESVRALIASDKVKVNSEQAQSSESEMGDSYGCKW